MTNTKFRKRALISSVAMLLVALVALGSATFAWFTANPKANASGLKLKTTASTGLVVKTETDPVWSHAAALNAEETSAGSGVYQTKSGAFNLTPASENQTTPTTFHTVSAGLASRYEAEKDGTIGTASSGHTGNEDVYSENIYFRISDGGALATSSQKVALTGVTLNKATGATMDGCIRVSVVNQAGTLVGVWSLATKDPHGAINASTDLTTAGTPAEIASYTVDTLTVDTAGTGLTGKTVIADASVLDNTDNNDDYCTVYVWLDGQDGNCYSDKVGSVNAAAILSSIQLDFELV